MSIYKYLLILITLVSSGIKVLAQDLTPKSDTMMVMDEEKGTEHGEVKWGYQDQTGKWIVPPVYDYAGPFTEGMAPVGLYAGGWKYGYVNQRGELAINLMYDVVSKFNEGLAYVAILNISWQDKPEEKKYHKIGYIDKTNNMVITLPAEFCKPDAGCYYKGEPYSGGFAKLKASVPHCPALQPIVIDRNSVVKIVKE